MVKECWKVTNGFCKEYYTIKKGDVHLIFGPWQKGHDKWGKGVYNKRDKFSGIRQGTGVEVMAVKEKIRGQEESRVKLDRKSVV